MPPSPTPSVSWINEAMNFGIDLVPPERQIADTIRRLCRVCKMFEGQTVPAEAPLIIHECLRAAEILDADPDATLPPACSSSLQAILCLIDHYARQTLDRDDSDLVSMLLDRATDTILSVLPTEEEGEDDILALPTRPNLDLKRFTLRQLLGDDAEDRETFRSNDGRARVVEGLCQRLSIELDAIDYEEAAEFFRQLGALARAKNPS
jgi:hypothetical protein